MSLRLLSLFSGIGAFEKALERLGVETSLVGFCEIDGPAAASYGAIHGVDPALNLRDVTKIDTADLAGRVDLVTYGFPCQDISIGGRMRGFEDAAGNRTRSGLFFEALRIIEDVKPAVAIAENVKNLVSDAFAQIGTSDAQMYKQTGNSIVVDVLQALFEELLWDYPGLFEPEGTRHRTRPPAGPLKTEPTLF